MSVYVVYMSSFMYIHTESMLSIFSLLPLSSIGSDHGEVARKRVEHYNTALQTQRRQAGLISDASSDLLEAERRLAEVCPPATLSHTVGECQ